MAQPPDPYTPHRPVPAKPIISAYPTPDFNDRVYKVHKDTRAPGYRLPKAGAIFTGPDAEKYKDFLFCIAIPSDQTGWVDWVYVNDRLNQDAYNYQIEYPWEDQEWPRITRTYVTLRAKYAVPDPEETDSVHPKCVLVDQKETRLEDPALNVLFVGVTKVFERIPAETEVVLDRADSVLPFNMRVAVPGIQVTTIEEGAVGTGDVPEIVNEEDWNISDTTRTVFSRTRKRTKRVIPNGSFTLGKAQRLTREQQLATGKETWAIGPQVIVPRATTVEATVEDVGNNTTVKTEMSVDRVFPEPEFKIEIPDLIPPEFRALTPTTTEAVTSEGQAAPPVLGVGELERISRQVTDLIKRDQVTKRDISQLPVTLIDKELDEIQSHGSGFGGVFEDVRTLDDSPQTVDEGFEITKSSVRNLGNGLTLKDTHKLSGVQGAHLLLTNPGSGFVCNPAVVFTSGTIGSDAEATAILSSTPGGGGVLPGEDAGGVFNLVPGSFGDTNGFFHFIGARYNSGVWRNPFQAGNVNLHAASDPQFPVSEDSLAKLVNRVHDDMNVTPVFNSGSHAIYVELAAGMTLKATHLSIQLPTTVSTSSLIQKVVRVQGSNNGGVTWTSLGSDITLSFTGSRWVLGGLTNPNAYRLFQIFGTNGTPVNPGSDPEVYNSLRLSEIEFYGQLTIAPGTNRAYQFDGDTNGVFFYMGLRGGNGTWRNPSANGDIVVTADGLSVGSLDEIVDRLPSNVYTDGNPARAYYFDLEAGRSLICNKISFRQRTLYGSGTVSFNLQGRNDLGDPLDWTDLVTVYPSQTPDRWTTVSVPGGVGYRQFRIISPQPYFTTGELELYGTLSLGPPAGDTFSVTSVNVTNGGQDYPTNGVEVRFIGGGGSGAAGTAVVSGGVITGVQLTNSGSGYTTAPDVRFFILGGGKDAAATGNIGGGGVTSYTITNPGSEYPTAPLAEIVGDGTGATATVTVNALGEVTAVTPVLPGTGYTTASVLFRNAGGPTAIAIVGKGVTSVPVSNGGSNYITPPAVDIHGDGSGVQAHSILGFPIGSVNVNNRGSGYTSTPTATPGGGGTGASLTAVRGFPVASVSFSPNATLYLNEPAVVVSGGGVFGAGAQFRALVLRPLLSIQLGLQGSNYSPDNTVVITPVSGGSGAAAHVDFSYAVDSITGGLGGTGYTTATVTIDPPTGLNGVQATAHATFLAGAIDSIVIDNPGFGYLTAPVVTVTGNGTGASAATAVLETNGAIDAVVLDTPGSGFALPPTITLVGTSGSGAVLTAYLNTTVSGTLSSTILIVSAGSGYTSAPTLVISGAPAPTATLSTTGQIVAVTVVLGGSGYTQNFAVGFSGGGGGSGASATSVLATVDPLTGAGLGKVKSVVVDNPGEGFETPPPVVFLGGHGTGSSTNAVAAAVLGASGKIKTLTLIDPGPDYSVAPLVSFFGCSGVGATALYILASGFPILTDFITDPVEGIVVKVVKKIVRPETARPSGYVDVFALNKYRSIQITSSIDLNTLPPTDHFFMTHVLNMPGTLLSVSANYNRTRKIAVGIDTAFGSTSVKSSVDGKIFAKILDGYKGPAKAEIFRNFLVSAPSAGQTPNPLIITPASGSVYLVTNANERQTSLGVRGGFGYIEDSTNQDSNVSALDISGVLTGGLIANSGSGPLTADPTDAIAAAIARARIAGFIFDGFRTNVASNIISAEANLFVDIPASCPRVIDPGTSFLLSAVVEKWRFGLYVQTLTYVTIPCPAGTNLYGACAPCNGGTGGGET